VLHLGDGVLLESDVLGPNTAPRAHHVTFPGDVARPHHQGGHQVHHRRTAKAPQPPPSLHETTSSALTEGERVCVFHYGARSRSGDEFDIVSRSSGRLSSKSAQRELGRVELGRGFLLTHDGGNLHVSKPHKASDGKRNRRQKTSPPSSALSSEFSEPPFSEPVSLPPAPPSTASDPSRHEDEMQFRTRGSELYAGPNAGAPGVIDKMLEQELGSMVDDDVEEAISTLEAIECASMPLSPPPPRSQPTREAAPVMGQLDAFAEVAKTWYGALTQLLKERDGATATVPGQSERKRRRLEEDAAVADGSSLLHCGAGSHLEAPLSSVVRSDDLYASAGANTGPAFSGAGLQRAGVRPFGGKPHPNPHLTTIMSAGKPQPACAGKPGPSARMEIATDSGPSSNVHDEFCSPRECETKIGGNALRNALLDLDQAGGACEMKTVTSGPIQRRNVAPLTNVNERSTAPGPAPSVQEESATASQAIKPLKRKVRQRNCAECGATETPKWRCNGTLCNACGLKYPREVVRPRSSFGRALELFQPVVFSGKQSFQAPQFPWNMKTAASKPEERVAIPRPTCINP